MAFKIEKQKPKAESRPALTREDKLRWLLKAVAVYLMALGAFYCLVDSWTGWKLSVRFAVDTYPLLRSLGVTQLVFGIFLWRARFDGHREPLAVDVLLLYFLGQMIFHISSFRRSSYTHFEYLPLALDTAFTVALFWLRNTKSLAVELWERELRPRIKGGRAPVPHAPAPGPETKG
jgi:hypothetical protein